MCVQKACHTALAPTLVYLNFKSMLNRIVDESQFFYKPSQQIGKVQRLSKLHSCGLLALNE